MLSNFAGGGDEVREGSIGENDQAVADRGEDCVIGDKLCERVG